MADPRLQVDLGVDATSLNTAVGRAVELIRDHLDRAISRANLAAAEAEVATHPRRHYIDPELATPINRNADA